MLIKRGRDEAWLRQPVASLPTWATFNNASFNGVAIGVIPGSESKGCAVVSNRSYDGVESETLMAVPRSLILSLESIEEMSKADKHLHQLLQELGDFGRTTRGAVLAFLLLQATIACPDVPHGIGIVNPLTDYIKFLPEELLPTFWTEEEQGLLIGTSLKPAVSAKLKSLSREFTLFQEATQKLDWCKKHWWDSGLVTFDDWKQVDAMYRSRALEFPGIGDAMVPCIDMANHASGDATVALYESDDQGNAVLLLRQGKTLREGEEVTITYGDEKGACEMLFSYGFLEDSMDSARAVFLDLGVQEDDPLGIPKMSVCTCAPGFRVFDKDGMTQWESDFVWLAVVNEEDGFAFNFAQTNDGQQELRALWKDHELRGTGELGQLLKEDDLYKVFRLRAVALIQNRVEQQMQLLYEQEGEEERQDQHQGLVRDAPKRLTSKLRRLELELLEKSYGALEDEKLELFETETVQQYLASQNAGTAMEEQEEPDFS